MTPRTYSTPLAFKQALEQRLRAAAKSGDEFGRRRQLLVFERFLARIVEVWGDAAILKGGLVLKLRLETARTTKDVDLRVTGSPKTVLARLQEAARLNLGDFMTFEVGPDEDSPDIQNDDMVYEGQRFRAACSLAGKVYGGPFGVDVAFGDPMIGEPELIETEDVLRFAGIAPTKVRLYPPETHVAEKLHAYTLPRSRPNSRVKDLPDLALLATAHRFESSRLHAALEQTFGFRKTHAVPVHLPSPPVPWEAPYANMARDNRLIWSTLDEVTDAARAFLDPVLSGELGASWAPDEWKWKAGAGKR